MRPNYLRMQRRLNATAMASLLLFVAASCPGALRASAPSPPGSVGSALPGFTAQTLTGDLLSSGEFAGRILVLNVWATWCQPCRIETSDLIAAYQRQHASDVAFLGLDDAEPPAVVKAYLSVHNVPYQTVFVPRGFKSAFAVFAMPTTIVVDRDGIIRGRWLGALSQAQLESMIAAARDRRNLDVESPEQRKIDAMLAPSDLPLSGGRAAVLTSVGSIKKQVSEAQAYEFSLPDSVQIDGERVQREEGTLLYDAGSALQGVAASSSEHAEADALLGKALVELGEPSKAIGFDRAALEAEPGDTQGLLRLANAYYTASDYAEATRYVREYIAVKPASPSAYHLLGASYKHEGLLLNAAAAFEKSSALYIADIHDAAPSERSGAAADAVDELLTLADVYVALGDKAKAQLTFDRAQRNAQMVTPGTPEAEIRDRATERTAEGMTAIALSHDTPIALSLTAWTGRDLPGSVASTYKYRLIAVANQAKSVTLTTRNLGAGWIASFCADGVCWPNSVTFVPPQGHVKQYEFQLIPPKPGLTPSNVEVVSGTLAAPLP